MIINGQGAQDSPARRSNRLRMPLHGKALKTQSPTAPSLKTKPRVETAVSGQNMSCLPLEIDRSCLAFGASPFKSQSLLLLGIVILMHAMALYLFTRATDIKMPAVSIPLSVSFALAEPVEQTPVTKPKAKPKTLATAEQQPVREQAVDEPQTQATDPRFDVSHLKNPVPVYPALSKRLGEQGEVVLRVYVTPEGTAAQVEIHSSSGYPRLDRAARETVERWKFMPAKKGDEPVGAWVLIPIPYILKG